MNEVLVLHLCLIHIEFCMIQHIDWIPGPKIFWLNALYEEIPLSELIIEIHYCRWEKIENQHDNRSHLLK